MRSEPGLRVWIMFLIRKKSRARRIGHVLTVEDRADRGGFLYKKPVAWPADRTGRQFPVAGAVASRAAAASERPFPSRSPISIVATGRNNAGIPDKHVRAQVAVTTAANLFGRSVASLAKRRDPKRGGAAWGRRPRRGTRDRGASLNHSVEHE